ncbi:MAG: aminotransferase class V-fold PLP-dependent enzyme [Gammaproteobacteria bacterium]|nr:aminotransferase class V-fold PLP-dependent enzyme [Gammaproteobacteria bacterium]
MDTPFKLDDDIIYVNHAAVAPWPQVSVQAVKDFADENGHVGSRHYMRWLKIEQELKQRLATLINAASVDEIALLKNTSEGLSVIAYGLDWQAGDNIIIAAEEFPSNRIVWESLVHKGVNVQLVDLNGAADPEQLLISHINEHTRLLSVSGVQYARGLRMDLLRLGKACRQNRILFCVDAIQQLGAMQLDAQAIFADFVVADGHKWLLGPEGLALFYCRRELLPRLKLQQFGWHMVENFTDFDNMDQWQPAHSARRFECGSPNLLAAHALHASVGLLLDTGMANVEQQVLSKVQKLIGLFSLIAGVSILSPTQIQRHAGIFTFSIGIADQALYQHLVNRGVVCALRGGGIRFSPHFYTSDAKLDTLALWVEIFITSQG